MWSNCAQNVLTPTRLPVGAFRRFICTKLQEFGHSRTKSIHTLASQAYEPVTSGLARTLAHLYRSTWKNVELLVLSRTNLACWSPQYRIVLEPLPIVCGHKMATVRIRHLHADSRSAAV